MRDAKRPHFSWAFFATMVFMVSRRFMKNGAGLAISLTILAVILLMSRPSETNLGLSFAPLLLLWAIIYFSGGIVVDTLLKNARRSVAQVVRVIVASSVTLLVMFNALASVSPLDIFILVSLAALGSFYFSRTWTD
jgi:hypothetical protein